MSLLECLCQGAWESLHEPHGSVANLRKCNVFSVDKSCTHAEFGGSVSECQRIDVQSVPFVPLNIMGSICLVASWRGRCHGPGPLNNFRPLIKRIHGLMRFHVGSYAALWSPWSRSSICKTLSCGNWMKRMKIAECRAACVLQAVEPLPTPGRGGSSKALTHVL